MNRKRKIQKSAETFFARTGKQPIFEILLIVDPDKPLLDTVGNDTGMPDLSDSFVPGFYFKIDDAVKVMHTNMCDIHEDRYAGGFVLCRYPGVYDEIGPDRRLFFRWDEEKKGYVEDEEPDSFEYISL